MWPLILALVIVVCLRWLCGAAVDLCLLLLWQGAVSHAVMDDYADL